MLKYKLFLIPIAAFFLFALGEALYISILQSNLEKISQEKRVLEINYELSKQDLFLCKGAISNQNEEIERYKVDLDKANKLAKEKQHELEFAMKNKRVEIVKELFKDPSSENQVQLIHNILTDYLGGN